MLAFVFRTTMDHYHTSHDWKVLRNRRFQHSVRCDLGNFPDSHPECRDGRRVDVCPGWRDGGPVYRGFGKIFYYCVQGLPEHSRTHHFFETPLKERLVYMS